MGSKRKPPIIGYRYYMGLHMGVCRGPVDELVAIKVGDKVAWSGSVTASGQISIDQPNLFGGDKGEGGIQGPLDVMMGEPTQVAPSWLSKLHGALLPAFRGMFTLAFNGEVCALSPNPQPWSMRQRRVLKGWPNDDPWYPDKALIALSDANGNPIHAMNPAHIIYQCTIDPGFGRGLDPSYIDDASFRAAADQLYAEGFGLCLGFKRQGPVGEFIAAVIDHIGAALGVDYSTGLLSLTLIRGDYDPETLPLFTPDTGLVAVQDDASQAQETQPNEVVVEWVDPVTGNGGVARAPNVAAITNMGCVISTTKSYPGIPTEALAQRVAVRDVTVLTAGTRGFKVTLDQRGYKLRPGALFRIGGVNGIANMVLRAGKREDGRIEDGRITITAVQDVFGMPATTWLSGSPSEWTPPDQVPHPCPQQRVDEAGYRDLVRELSPADLAALPDDACYVATCGTRPSGLALSYTPATKASGEPAFVPRGAGAFTPTATLTLAIGPTDTALVLAAGVDLAQVAVGSAAWIDDEIVRIDALDAVAGTATIARGCADTVPAAHAIGARLWCYDDFAGSDDRDYVDGETVDAKLLTHTASGDLDLADATAITVTMAQRAHRPYPPAGLAVNGDAFPSLLTGDLALAWAHRDRLLQADQLIDQTAASIGPEPGTSYTARIYFDGSLEHTETAIAGTSWSYSPTATSGLCRIEIESVRDSLTSWQMQVRQAHYLGAVDALATDAGDFVVRDDDGLILLP